MIAIYLFNPFFKKEEDYLIGTIGVSDDKIIGTLNGFKGPPIVDQFDGVKYEIDQNELIITTYSSHFPRSFFKWILYKTIDFETSIERIYVVPPLTEFQKKIWEETGNIDEVPNVTYSECGHKFQLKGDFENIERIYQKTKGGKKLLWERGTYYHKATPKPACFGGVD